MSKTKLKDLDKFSVLNSGDTLFGKSQSAGKYGFFPIDLLTSGGYAGRRWNQDLSTPVGEVVGSVEFLRNFPSLIGLGCYLVDDAHNRRKLDPTDHYKLATGETAKLDGSMGQYMWGWNTPFYITIYTEGSYLYEVVSLKPLPGRECYRIPVASKAAGNAGIMDRTNLKLCSLLSDDAQYRGGNGAALTDGNASSDNLAMLGYPATAISTEQFQKYGAARGTGWGAGWYWIETVTMVLFQVIFGTRHCQTAVASAKDSNGLYQGGLGAGVSQMPSWEAFNKYYPVVPYSAGVELADGVGETSHEVKNSSGTTVYTAKIPVFFGLKNPYGHLYLGKNLIVAKKGTDGSYDFYVAKSSKETWSYSDTSKLLFVGSLAARSEAGWDYISKLNFNGLAGMPSECAGTASTYYADGCYRDIAVSVFRSPLGSGYADLGSSDGLAYFNGHYAPSNSTAPLSSPLCETPDDFNPVPQVYTV